MATPGGLEPPTNSLEGGVNPIKPSKLGIAEVPILPVFLGPVSPALAQLTPG